MNTEQAFTDARAALDEMHAYGTGATSEAQVEAAWKLGNAFNELDAELNAGGALPASWASAAHPLDAQLIAGLVGVAHAIDTLLVRIPEIRQAVADVETSVAVDDGNLTTAAARLAELVRQFTGPDKPDKPVESVDDKPPVRYRFTHHYNDLGDWCPWSNVKVSVKIAESDDTACPAAAPAATSRKFPAMLTDELYMRRRGERPPDSLLLRRALRRLRKEAGLSGTQAAKLFGITAPNLNRAENGLRLPFSAYRMSLAFGVPLDDVLVPCPQCGYDPRPGFKCLRCGASERDLHTCPSCDHTAGTVHEVADHIKTAHPIRPDQTPCHAFDFYVTSRKIL